MPVSTNKIFRCSSNLRYRPLDGDLILPILRDIAQGMRFLHVHKPPIIHCDLKAENCLIDSHFRAKVADFGLSAKETLGVTGTPYWMVSEAWCESLQG